MRASRSSTDPGPSPAAESAPAATPAPPAPSRVTLSTLARMARAGTPFSCLTCYDASTARLLAAAGVHVLLVGDTAAEMVLGFTRTIDMNLDVLLALTAGVKRGAPHAVVMGDMPFMSYQAGVDDAVTNAGRFLVEGRADVVKLEVDASFALVVSRMTRAGIPVCAHIGSRPQRVAMTGGYSAAGRTPAQARQIVEDAVAMERAGAIMLLIEAVPESVTRAVLARTRLPVIGIGAGPACHGQVVVLHDVLGLSTRPPAFAPVLAHVGQAIEQGARAWVELVARRGVGPSPYTSRRPSGNGVSGVRGGARAGSGAGAGAVRTASGAGARNRAGRSQRKKSG